MKLVCKGCQGIPSFGRCNHDDHDHDNDDDDDDNNDHDDDDNKCFCGWRKKLWFKNQLKIWNWQPHKATKISLIRIDSKYFHPPLSSIELKTEFSLFIMLTKFHKILTFRNISQEVVLSTEMKCSKYCLNIQIFVWTKHEPFKMSWKNSHF